MCSGGECTPEHKEYTSHLMACNDCCAASGSLCGLGRALKMENDARFIAGLPDLPSRRHWMITMRREYGDRAALIEQAVKDKFSELGRSA